MQAGLIVALASLAVVLVACAVPARAADVRGFALPAGFTVDPESATRAVGRSANGIVVAKAVNVDARYEVRALRWSRAGELRGFPPLSVRTNPDPDAGGPSWVEAVAAAPNEQYVTVAHAFGGAYSGVATEAQLWRRVGSSRWRVPRCVQSGDALDEKVFAVDSAGRVALTMDMTGQGAFLVLRDDFSRYAPYAFVIDGTNCRRLGRATVVDVSGAWATGFRGYFRGQLAPTNLGDDSPVAVRWNGTTLTELGRGDALAVTSSGMAVGATAIPGGTENPRAVAWDVRGRQLVIDARDVRSVAYDIANVAGIGTAVGMAVAADGRHYAFRWRAGRFERLDDLPHPSGWRFESAFTIAGDGTIAGIGTLNGIPTVFVWRSSSRRLRRGP